MSSLKKTLQGINLPIIGIGAMFSLLRQVFECVWFEVVCTLAILVRACSTLKNVKILHLKYLRNVSS